MGYKLLYALLRDFSHSTESLKTEQASNESKTR
jgi:hypothetical protein